MTMREGIMPWSFVPCRDCSRPYKEACCLECPRYKSGRPHPKDALKNVDYVSKMADDLGQNIPGNWISGNTSVVADGYRSDAEATSANYIRTLEKHSQISPDIIDRVIELHLKDAKKK